MIEWEWYPVCDNEEQEAAAEGDGWEQDDSRKGSDFVSPLDLVCFSVLHYSRYGIPGVSL